MTKLLLAASAALILAGPAFAQTADDQAPTQTVSTRNVDFSNKAQVSHFYAKLRGAAQAVCDSGSVNSSFSNADATCVRQVMDSAVRVANKPVLTAMYQGAQDNNGRAFAGNDQ
jgi:UrcA family protein